MSETDFKQQGYVVYENFISHEECDALKTRASLLCEQETIHNEQVVFETHTHHFLTNEYFLQSASSIACFYEEDAFDQGKLKTNPMQSINKIGHALHVLDPIFAEFSQSNKIFELATTLKIHDPKLLQSMVIFKQPKIGGRVDCHQDSTFLYTEKNSLCGFWFALEDATIENGCLWVLPQGHHHPLTRRLIRNANNELSFIELSEPTWNIDHFIPLQVKKGTLILLDGKLPHFSRENRSQQKREAYILHLMAGDDHFSSQNWLQSQYLPIDDFARNLS